jgi:hypothetical protein
MDVPVCIPLFALPQPQRKDSTQSHDRSHKLQQIDICVSDVPVIANILEEVWGIKRVPSHSRDIETHAITMLCTCVHEHHVISQGCLAMHSLDRICTRLIAQQQWDADGEYEPSPVMEPELQDPHRLFHRGHGR